MYITPELIDEHKRSGIAMTEIDPYVFNHHVWGFLQHCLSGSARQVFKRTPRQDGMNVWRQLVLKINSKTECRQQTLRNKCQSQAQVSDERYVEKAIADWEDLYSQYLDAGGPRCTAYLRSAVWKRMKAKTVYSIFKLQPPRGTLTPSQS